MNIFIKIITILSLGMALNTNAQNATRVLFESNFGNPPTNTSSPTNNSGIRQRWDYMPTDVNTFVFANQNAKNIVNPGTETSWNEAQHIDNNFYAVVGPKYIYSSVGTTRSAINGFWNQLSVKGDATTGHNGNGGALIINAGTTLSSFTVGIGDLKPGKYYKLTYKLFVENGTVIIKQNIISPSGNTKLISIESPVNGQNASIGNWVNQTYWFYLPESCSADTYYIALENANAANQGNDYAIDDLKFEEFDSRPSVASSTISCNISEPISNDDQSLRNTKGNSVTVNVYNNDYLSDRVTKATSSNATFMPLVPIGAYVNPYNSKQIIVNGEGTWSYEANGNVTFTPSSSFNGNPTPLSYRFTDNATKGSSNISKVLITYTGNLTAYPDVASSIEGAIVRINILANDTNTTGSTVQRNTVNTIFLINPFSLIENANSMTISKEGTWNIDSTTKELIFTPEVGFTGSPTPIQYYFTDTSGNKSNKVYVTVNVSKTINSEICTEEVQGEDFEVRDGQSKTFSMPATDYGFRFDIYELDNSFNLTINGVQLAKQEIQFQKVTQAGNQNIRFKDGTVWQEGNIKEIWNLRGTKEAPLVRIVIDPYGNITMFGSKTSGGPLEPLELFNGNTFNTIKWNTAARNTIIATQSVENITIMRGHGSGMKMVPCFCTKTPNSQPADAFTSIGVSTKRTKANNWPQAIPNGFIAVESSNKGLVITRTSDLSKITDPKEGMIVYDKTDRCVKLYNGTSWKCLKRSCND